METKVELVGTDKVRAEMIQHIHAHSKNLPLDYLEELDEKKLLGECHPNYREYFTTKLKNA